MIYKSLGYFILTFVLWELVLRVWQPSMNSAQTDWQKNIVRGEEILNSKETRYKARDFVILGSSLAKRLDMTYLPNAVNFSLGGLSVFDGLNLLDKLDCNPDTLLVEINVITRPENLSYKEQILCGLKPLLNPYITALRSKNQPIGLLTKYASAIFSKIANIKNVEAFKIVGLNKTKIQKPHTKTTTVFQEGMQHRGILRQYSSVDTTAILKAVGKLKANLKKIKKQGSVVILFEAPVYYKARHLPFAQTNREIVSKEFVDYRILPMDTSRYLTTDGVHLNLFESKRYSKYLAEAIKSDNSRFSKIQ